jgi:hypothetical protein
MGKQAVSYETREAFMTCMHLCMMVFCGMCVVGILFSMGRLNPSAKRV